MGDRDRYSELLSQILNSNNTRKNDLIREFQNEIWNNESVLDEELSDILTSLAYDLDFYEPNENLKKESLSYFGEEILNKVLIESLKKISSLNR
jgi:hypothetical protein